MTNRLITLLAASLMVLVAQAAPAAETMAYSAPAAETMDTSAPAVARDHVIIDADVVRLGDLFANAGPHADKAVAYAPEPGQKSVFDLQWLYRVAKAYRLNWRPENRRVSVTVQRDAQVIGRDEIADHILAALIDKGADKDLLVDISNRSLRLFVPSGRAAMVGIEDVTFDRRTGRFTAIVAAPADDPGAKRVRVTGQAHKMIEVPVLARRVLKGEIIGQGDIKWMGLRADRVATDVILSAEDLIGKTARRGALRDNQPIRAREIRRPLMVKKGSLVTMVMNVPNMTLTSKGRALEDGSDGDTIRVSNSQSNSIVETIVTGAQRVSVVPVSHQLALADAN